jgi:integrase
VNQLDEVIANTRGVNKHGKTLRLHFKLPGDKKFTKKTTGLSATKVNLSIAIKKLASIELDISAGMFAIDPKMFWQKHFPTNNEFLSDNFTITLYVQRYKIIKDGTLSYSSMTKIDSCFSWLRRNGFANKNLKSITSNEIEILRNKTLATLKESTVKEYMNTFKSVLEEAFNENVINFNPFLKVRKVKIDKDPTEEEDVFPFNQSDLQRLLDVVQTEQTRYMIEFLAWTGMRPGEMKALAWEDIDLDQGLIKVRYNIDRQGRLKPPKTSAGIRTIEAMPKAMAVLMRQRVKTFMLATITETVHLKFNKTKSVVRRRVFLSRENKPFIRPELNTVKGAWAGWLRQAKLIHRPPYQLRHTFASQMLTAGAEPMWLAKQLGHSDWGMIRKIYGKWIASERPDHRVEIAKKLGQHDPYMTHLKTEKTK